MNKASLYLSGLLALSSLAVAQTEETVAPSATPVAPVVVAPAKPAPAPAPRPAIAPAAPKPVVKPVTPTPAISTPARQAPAATTAATPAAAIATTPAASVAPAAENMLTAAPVATIEQRRQQELLVNAERVDKANRELLARNQELQLQNENLAIQNNVLKLDRSSEGIWKGAGAVIVGFLMGWFFSGAGRRKSSW